MHIDKDAAGLVAQVFPTLLIALLIDGRLKVRSSKSTRWYVIRYYLRLAALFSCLGSTFSCLWVYATGKTGPWVSAIVILTVILLFVAVGEMISRHIGDEGDEIFGLHKARKPDRKQRERERAALMLIKD